jgi:IclR family mhp operon transcriptional activator
MNNEDWSNVPKSGTIYIQFPWYYLEEIVAKLENRSLDRGIRLLEVLAGHNSCSLADLHRESGIPKSTIRRLLGTLISRHMVRRSLADQRYRINITLPASTGGTIPPELAVLVDVAMPHAVELTKTIDWPSDLHIIDGSQMRIVDSTRPLSPFHLYSGLVNRKLNMFGSASGMACLAEMPDDFILEMDRATKGDRVWGLARFNLTYELYLEEILKTRLSGYGTRLAKYLGETVLDDGLAAIAIPLKRDKRPLGALTVLWPRVYKKHTEFIGEFLPALRDTTEAINADLCRYGKQP